MKQGITKMLAAVLLVMAAGCAQVGMAPAQSLDEKLAYAESQVTAIRTSTAQALLAGTITVGEAQGLLATTDSARTAIDGAKAAEAVGDTATAQGKLTVVLGTLTSIQTFLVQHQAAKAAGSK